MKRSKCLKKRIWTTSTEIEKGHFWTTWRTGR